MTTTTRSLWRMRLARAWPRYLLYALCAAGLLASVRFAIAPPRASTPPTRDSITARPDLAAQGYATLFARRYLTWDAGSSDGGLLSLGSLAGADGEPSDGLRLPSSGEQRVIWAEVVQARERAPGNHVYTVAVQTDTAGLLYLTIDVLRRPDGALALAGYPAFVGAPASGAAQASMGKHEIRDPRLDEVVERALHNYLSASAQDLAADLASGARVSLPSIPFALESVVRMSWSPDERSVLAVVQARDRRGVSYTLEYELDVVAKQGRWEITAIQMDPDA